MGSENREGYSLTEIFAIKFVLADIVIIAALIFAGPATAITITALLVVSVFLVWYLTQRVETGHADETGDDKQAETRDPVSELQHRYAAGELTDEAFERKLEALIEANERADRAGVETTELALEGTK